jgi:hypothetical protein
VNPTFTAPAVDGRVSLVFKLTVSDGSLTTSDTMTVKVIFQKGPGPVEIWMGKNNQSVLKARQI